MASDKKINKDKLPHPEKDNKQARGQEEFDDRSKQINDKKLRRVNYVVKDLPIY